MGKSQVGPIAMVGAVIVAILIIFGIYKMAFKGDQKISEDKIPAYAKARMQGGGVGAGGANAPMPVVNHAPSRGPQ